MSQPTYFVAGATGTVGSRVFARLVREHPGARVVRGVRRAETDDTDRRFDLTRPREASAALHGVDAAFLMLPPGLSRAGERFGELLRSVPEGRGPRRVVFMSVQGAESRGYLPHAKAEAALRGALRERGDLTALTVLRPSYFMQNLETAFRRDLAERRELVAPLGAARLLWVDAGDIARAAVVAMRSREGAGPDLDGYRAFAITGTEHRGFGYVAETLSRFTGEAYRYRAVGPLAFYRHRRRQGVKRGGAAVQAAIHFAERWGREAPVRADYTYLTGQPPRRLDDYLRDLGGRLEIGETSGRRS